MKILKRRIKEFQGNEEGVSIVIIALSFTMLLLIMSLVMDYGIAYNRTGELKNASDAAVLAAGLLLPVKVDDAVRIQEITLRAVEYANKNGANQIEYSDIILGDIVSNRYTSISVNLDEDLDTTLASVIGVDIFNLARSSKARIAPVEKVTGVVPFAIKKDVIESSILNGFTRNIALKFGGGSGIKGDYGVIDLDGVKGGGANDVELWLTYGYTLELSAGDALYPIEPGNMAGAINQAVDARYNLCTHFIGDGGCNVDHFDPSCPRVLFVPIVQSVDSMNVKIYGFAAFVLEPLTDSGFVYGSIIDLTVPGLGSDSIEVGDLQDYGLYSVILAD